MFGGVEVAAAGAGVAVHGQGPGFAEVEQGARGGVLGAGQGVVEDVDGGACLVEPDALVGEVGEDARSAVVVAEVVRGVEGRAPVVAGVGVVFVVEAVPSDRLGKGGGQSVEAGSGRLVVAGVFKQADDGVVIAVEDLAAVLAVRGGHAREVLDAALQPGDELRGDGLAVGG
ncbi:hypothetical protein QT196_05005 [Streptomyces sp. P9-2B-2]|uniref:hypothetical protein n=1 Tax=Streptomyces sp. P9-2B-2 TaxID=3057114 RepID=UPI0025B45347|nr:hypothetical protein [Streptomyces sp. P9-2B-2]WJY36685.1 hypothetical protein QT196_05005 [Streptomyces sp. P9-2B-2]